MRPILQMLMYMLRVLAYKSISYLRQLKYEVTQMSIYTSVQNFLASLSRSRKIVLSLIVIFVIILYMWPSWLKLGTTDIHLSPLGVCVDAKLQPFRHSAEKYDVVIVQGGRGDSTKNYSPFVGNGYIGTTTYSRSKLHIKTARTISLEVNFYPIVQINIEGLASEEGTVIDFIDGLVHKVQCFQIENDCVTATSQIYAHKKRPSVFIQEYRIHNPSQTPVTVDLEQIAVSDWAGSETKTSRTSSKSGLEADYHLTTGTVQSQQLEGHVIVVAIASAKLPESVTVKAGLSWKYHTVTCVKFSSPVKKQKAISQERERLLDEVDETFKTVMNIDGKILKDEHTSVWKNLWSSGFGISVSRAPGSLNGDKINSTIYYVLSHVPSPIHEEGQSPVLKSELEKLLYFPDRCYDGHHTLQNYKLWGDTSSVENVISLVNTWLITLEKQGCVTMLRAGADGALQAMILSFGGLKFSNDHLEFNTHPKDLHRDYHFRRISYGNHTHVNITVVVGEDNKAILYTALDRNDKPYYACDAGCIDPPFKLGRTPSKFPVKLTDPVTAVLYITADKLHMEELKHAIHVREIAEAPAHEHHVIALHRHGHHYGGLPTLFWVSIGILIFIFHLFLFKLIFNEYCNYGDNKYRSGRYNL